jgi:hypothetical protein
MNYFISAFAGFLFVASILGLGEITVWLLTHYKLNGAAFCIGAFGTTFCMVMVFLIAISLESR